MEYLLSALYTIVDVACLLLFLSAFAAPRFVRHKQWLLSGAYYTISVPQKTTRHGALQRVTGGFGIVSRKKGKCVTAARTVCR